MINQDLSELAAILLIIVISLLVFRRKGWL